MTSGGGVLRAACPDTGAPDDTTNATMPETAPTDARIRIVMVLDSTTLEGGSYYFRGIGTVWGPARRAGGRCRLGGCRLVESGRPIFRCFPCVLAATSSAGPWMRPNLLPCWM